ncbi:MAG: peroxide stress protein YaaA [Lishizhenia sp.]
MKILLSPAKSLDFSRNFETPTTSVATFIEEANYLAKKMEKLSAKKIADLMHLSPQLADLNYERYQNWVSPEKKSDLAIAAGFAFTGEVYKGLEIETLSQQELKKAQNELRILSGLYGLLKPLDLMYPYRLEMGTRFNVTPKTKNLYQYWGDKIAKQLNAETETDEVIINLASNEYFKAVDKKTIQPRIITPTFKELKGDTYKVVMMYAKHARGAMARDIIKNNYSSAEDLKGYNVDGYTYNESLSTENDWVFVR